MFEISEVYDKKHVHFKKKTDKENNISDVQKFPGESLLLFFKKTLKYKG